MCIFPPLYMSGWSDVENEQRSGCGKCLMRIFICVWQKKYFYMFLFCNGIM